MLKMAFLGILTSILTLSLGNSWVTAKPVVTETGLNSPLLAQNQTSNRKIKSRGGPERLMEQLNLSAEQKKEMQAIRQKYQGKTRPLHEQLRAQMEELRQMMDGNTSKDSIRAKHDQVINLRNQLASLRFEEMLENRDILTLEQRQQFAQLMQQRRAKMRASKGWGNGNPQDPDLMPLP
ncbi:MAG: Spy/CpxP family protein refolding chaperone [Microcystaceae cyanobacterium]|nr:Spy/CpxP family protein refolding chaperone [Merismopediaceae bacterium]